jgi:hypothetical protein
MEDAAILVELSAQLLLFNVAKFYNVLKTKAD